MKTDFKEFKNKVNKMGGVSSSAKSPKFWIDIGNYLINKTMSGKYIAGIPQGRLTQIAGPSGAGKSFIAGNLAKSAQAQGYGVLVVDSENALDDPFMEAIGVDTEDPDYLYVGLSEIDDCISVVQSFLATVSDLQDKDEKSKPFLIIIDSLDMLQTSSEADNYKKGVIKGDQGQHAKQIKRMLTGFMQDVKNLNVAMVCTKQVYQEQDPIAAMSAPWRITESLKFAFSQIMLVTKLQLRDKKTKNFEGIRLKVFGHKTRFTKPFQQCIIEVPYDEGMDPYSGILDACVSYDIVQQKGAWYTLGENKFQRKDSAQYNEEMLKLLIEREDELIDVPVDDKYIEESVSISEKDTTETRLTKGKKK